MRMRDPDDNGHRVRRKPRHVQPDRVDRPKPKPVTRSGDDNRERHVTRHDSVRGDEARIEGNRYRRREALDRDTDDTESNPTAAREQVSRASDASRRGTHSAPRFGSADAAEHYAQIHPTGYRGDESHHFGPDSVGDGDNPSLPETDEAEEGGDSDPAESNPDSNFRGSEVRRFGRNVDPAHPTEAPDDGTGVFEPGSQVPPAPVVPPDATTNSRDGQARTYQVGDQEVTQTSRQDGAIVTAYEDENGIPHTQTRYPDGRTTLDIGGSAAPGEDINTRNLAYDAEGNLVSDHVERQQYAEDGTRTSQDIHTIEYGSDGKPLRSNETSRTWDAEGNETSTRLVDTEHAEDGTTTRSERVRREDGTGYIATNTFDDHGRIVDRDTLTIGRDGLNPEQFTDKLADLVEAGDSGEIADILDFVGPENLAGVSLALSKSEPESLSSFIDAASAASALSPDVREQLARAMVDGIATNTYSDPPRPPEEISADLAAVGVVLSERIEAGGQAGLAVSFVGAFSELQQQENTKLVHGDVGGDFDAQQAYVENLNLAFEDVSTAVIVGFENRASNFDQAALAADEQSFRLGQLTESYGPPLSTQTQVDLATAEFMEAHRAEYDAANAASTGLFDNVDDVLRLRDILNDPAYSEDGELAGTLPGTAHEPQSRLNEYLDLLPDRLVRAGQEENGNAELAELVHQQGTGDRTTFIADLGALTDDPDKLEALETTVSNAGFGAAAEAVRQGRMDDVNTYLQGVADSSDDWTPEIIEELGEWASFGGDAVGTAAEALAAPNIQFGNPELRAKFGAAAATLGVASLLQSGLSLDDPTVEHFVSISADGTDVGAAVFQKALLEAFGEETLESVSRVTGGIGVALSAIDTYRAFRDGDPVIGGLNLIGTLGGVAALSGAPVVGQVVAVVAAAGTIGVGKYRETVASNYYEKDEPGEADARRFLQRAIGDAGLTGEEREAVYGALKNSDSDGSLPGRRIVELAEHAGIDPNDFFNGIASLGKDRASEVIEAIHSFGGDNAGLLRAIGEEDTSRDVTYDDLAAYVQLKTGLIDGGS